MDAGAIKQLVTSSQGFLLAAVHRLLQQLLVLLLLLAQMHLYYQELIVPSPVGTLAASVYKPTTNSKHIRRSVSREGQCDEGREAEIIVRSSALFSIR